MGTSEDAGPLVFAPPYADTAAGTPGGVVWALGDPVRDLDAVVVHVAPGADVGELAETGVGVLLVVVSGTGELRTAETVGALLPGSVAWLPAGIVRTVRAGGEGLTYAAAYRRRPPLTVSPVLRADGGEPPCLLDQVCVECGRLATGRDARYCNRCGTRLPH